MRLLLDTHAVLWAATAPDELAQEARRAVEDPAHVVRASVVTAWEIAIKQSLGKLELSRPAELWLPEVLERTGVQVAEVSLAAALLVRALPWHHRDPFDRLLIAQALEGGFTIVTRDEVFTAYGVPVLRA